MSPGQHPFAQLTAHIRALSPEDSCGTADADSAREAAWAAARGIQVAAISNHINSLTPAILRADTFLNDYRYENGRGNPHAIVLQAGAAVLADDHALPSVRCRSGDQLGPPPNWTSPPSFQGHEWSGFRPTALWRIGA